LLLIENGSLPIQITRLGIKIYDMKKLAYGLSAFFLSLSILGALFKIMHWPGAGVGLVVGICGLTLIAIPIMAVHKYKTS
jgi:hypothetical protein